jgi:dTDP-L-rhamnose 4-epimerase
MLESKTVLVTGGAGFIGSHTVDTLLTKGYNVRILDNLSKPVHTDEWPDYLPNYVEKILGSVTNRDDWLRALEGVTHVIHLAAYQDYLPNFSKFSHVNTMGTALLYELIVEKSLPIEKVVVASSQAVYGEGCYICMNGDCENFQKVIKASSRPEGLLKESIWDIPCNSCGEPLQPFSINEFNKPEPYNQYAISKYTQELISLNFGKRYNIPTTCLRYSIVQGPRQSFKNAYSGILRIFAQQAITGKSMTAYEDGKQLRDYISVYDVARANVLAMESRLSDYECYNIGGTNVVSVLDYAKTIAPNIEIEITGKYRFGDVRHIYSNCHKFQELGWRPELTLQEIIRGYLNWAVTQPDFKDYSGKAYNTMINLGVLRSSNA